MAPRRTLSRGAKGAADASGKPCSKKPKLADARVDDDTVESVVAALDRAADVSETSCEMLRSMAHGCLQTPAGERHPYQAAVADMFKDVFAGIEEGIRRDIRGGVAQIGEARAAKEACERELLSRQGAVGLRWKELEEEIARFGESNLALQAARQEHLAASEAYGSTAGSLAEAEALQKAVDETLDGNFRPLLDGTSKDPAADLEVLRPVLSRIAAEESLVSAFEVAAKLKPEARGLFDQAAMAQLQAEFEKQAVRLRETIAIKAADPALLSAKEAAGEAEARLAEARERQRQSAATLRLAEIDHQEAEGRRGSAEEEVQESDQAVQLSESRRVALEQSLDAFKGGPLAALEALLAKEAQEGQAASASAAPPAEEAAAALQSAPQDLAAPQGEPPHAEGGERPDASGEGLVAAPVAEPAEGEAQPVSALVAEPAKGEAQPAVPVAAVPTPARAAMA